ncbi:ATP-binding protein [Alloscardovia macacae]|uniref:Archaeal ATPase n=1 Tax=Alloscardovia macacae TaxID=1160091 RepID=A0A261F6C5_9BIFI|nr:ATP-binding protein [Alloscardovia macacae]OZG54625.1 Archaeal ATPase [Alloscardovia macacae]
MTPVTAHNPFTLNFGKTPLTSIDRSSTKQTILDEFRSPLMNTQVYVISGVRGSGKTVLLTEIDKELSTDPTWIVVELNSTRDLLTGLASKLYQLPAIRPLLVDAQIDLSLLGIGVKLSTSEPVTDIETGLERIFTVLAKLKKRVLICIDEVSNTQSMKEFASAFQIFMREDYPVYLLMTGLYENVSDLQNDENLTFLYRAPKVFLSPLNISAIKSRYMQLLGLDETRARMYAQLTKGYPYAFQLLGYLAWTNPEAPYDQLLAQFDQSIQEYVYQKIWADMSHKDHEVLHAIATLSAQNASESISIKDIRTQAGISSNLMNVYRNRLAQKGIVDTSVYGYLSLTLPRFDVYIRDYFVDASEI